MYDAKATSYYGGSSSNPNAFPPQLRHAPTGIAALVARRHLPTSSDDLEFLKMVTGDRDLIFDTLYTDSNSDLSPLESGEEEPSHSKENTGRLAAAPPPIRQAK